MIVIIFMVLLSGCKPKNLSHLELIERDTEIGTIGHEVFPEGYGRYKISNFHQRGIAGKGIKIAILDTGIDFNNAELQIDLTKSFLETTETVQDENGHGTKVAGIIGADINNYGVVGLAPEVSIIAGKVTNDGGNVSFEALIEGIKWSIEEKVDIINISLEFPTGTTELHEIIKEANNNNIIIIASSGSHERNSEINGIAFPARYDEVISVDMQIEATSISQKQDEKIYGKIDIRAPGTNIIVPFFDNKLTVSSGPSFSTAYVSGYTALLIQKYREDEKHYNREILIKDLNNAIYDNSGAFSLYLFFSRIFQIALAVIIVIYALVSLLIRKYKKPDYPLKKIIITVCILIGVIAVSFLPVLISKACWIR